MKHTIATVVAGLLLAASSYGQGTLFFSNKHGTVDAPVFFDSVGGQRINDANYVAQLYAGASAAALAPIGTTGSPFRATPAAGNGYWNPGADPSRTVASVAPGANAFAKVVVWDVSKFASYELAVTGGGKVGESTVFSAKTGGDGVPPALPQDLIGLTSFAITGGGVVPPVPEPTVLALGAIGGLALLLRRRKA
jgi:hypothetical protein